MTSSSSSDREKREYSKCMKKEKDDGGNKGLCARGKCSAKAKYEVYPSAYANGYASQVCHGEKPDVLGNKHGGGGKSTKSSSQKGGKKKSKNGNNKSSSDLHRWFQEEWVDVCASEKQGKKVPCGRDSADSEKRKYPYCRPSVKQPGTTSKTWKELSKSEIDKMCDAKRDKEEKENKKEGGSRKPNKVYLDEVLREKSSRTTT